MKNQNYHLLKYLSFSAYRTAMTKLEIYHTYARAVKTSHKHINKINIPA